jgi:UTP:GlnB (protein PII) uridylyltransferase
MPMPADFLASFRESMPPSYRQQQNPDDIREHALIAWRRGDEPVYAEIWSKRLNAVVVCVVADDRPGLPSLIRATVAAHGFDVVAAQNYCRYNERGRPEAIHLLWLSPSLEGQRGEANEQNVTSIAESVSALLRGQTDLGSVIERASSVPSSPGASVDVSTTEDVESDGAILLTVDAADNEGLLEKIASVLATKQVKLLASDRTVSGSRAQWRFHIVEADGSALSQDRVRDIASTLQRALE